MKCWVPSYNDCFAGLEQRAFEGTTCGNHMLCLQGTCVPNELASTTAGTCIENMDAVTVTPEGVGCMLFIYEVNTIRTNPETEHVYQVSLFSVHSHPSTHNTPLANT